MMMRGEFGEASCISHPPRSPSSPPQTRSHHYSPNFHPEISSDPSSSSSSRFCSRSPYSHSSYFSNGLCSLDDGSPQFTSPPLDEMMTKNGLMKKYSLFGNDFCLCENFDLLNIEEEEQDKTHRQNQLRTVGNYEPSTYDGFQNGVYSVFGVDLKDQPSHFPNQKDQIHISDHPKLHSYRKTLSSYSASSKIHRKSIVETLFDHQISSSNTHPSLLKVSELQGYVYLMAKDQHGCRLLQRIFEDGRALDSMIIFNELIPHVVELMINPFGNYLIQKLLNVCNEEQRTQIILMVTSTPGELIRISLNAYGTRVVQRLVESIKTKKQIYLVKSALRHGFLTLVRDQNGNHVIQRCLECLSTEDNEFIFDDAAKFCIDIATHRYGCCVLQKCIAYSTGRQRQNLLTEISRNSLFLAQDPYANYAVQVVLEVGDINVIATILAQLKGHYVELSTQKFSSHMVERCLKHFPESRPQIVRELISVPHFDLLIQDPYANFVIQAALDVTKILWNDFYKGSLHATLCEVIRPHWILHNHPHCKRIFSKIS